MAINIFFFMKQYPSNDNTLTCYNKTLGTCVNAELTSHLHQCQKITIRIAQLYFTVPPPPSLIQKFSGISCGQSKRSNKKQVSVVAAALMTEFCLFIQLHNPLHSCNSRESVNISLSIKTETTRHLFRSQKLLKMFALSKQRLVF